MKLGTARYGGEFKKINNWKLKDGDQVFRIFPPMGELADKGIWSVFWPVHWGYKNSAGKLRTFASPLVKNHKTKMIEVPDPALERINMLKAQLEKSKELGNKDAVDALLKLVGPKGLYNLDSNHHMVAMDLQGNIGILKIRHKCKVALDAAIKKMKDKGVDPLSVADGRFFVFSRAGMGMETTFQVTPYQQEREIAGVGKCFVEVSHTITPDIIGRLKDETRPLDQLFKKVTAEQVAAIVSKADLKTGVSPAVDEIFDTKAEASLEDPAADYGSEEDYQEPAAAVAAPKITPVAQAPAPAPVAAPVQAPAPVMAAPAPKPAPVPPVVTPAPAPVPPATTAQAVSQMSDEEFMKSLGL